MNKSKNINDLFSVKKLNIVITGASEVLDFIWQISFIIQVQIFYYLVGQRKLKIKII